MCFFCFESRHLDGWINLYSPVEQQRSKSIMFVNVHAFVFIISICKYSFTRNTVPFWERSHIPSRLALLSQYFLFPKVPYVIISYSFLEGYTFELYFVRHELYFCHLENHPSSPLSMQAGLRQFSASLRSELIYEKRQGGKSSVIYFFQPTNYLNIPEG